MNYSKKRIINKSNDDYRMDGDELRPFVSQNQANSKIYHLNNEK